MKFKHVIMTLGLTLGLGIGAIFGVNSRQTIKKASAYGNKDTTWFVTGEFNSWNKADSHYHLTYSGMSGSNWQFDSDYALHFEKDVMFKICYSWNDGANANEFVPDQNTNNTDFYVDDGLKATADINVLLYFQVYGEGASWTGMYWQTLNDDDAAIYNWSVDFLKATDSICSTDGTSADHSSALSAIWTAQKSAFEGLSAEAKAALTGTSGYAKVADAYNRYVHIMRRYNATLTAFTDGPSYSQTTVTPITNNTNNYRVAVISAVSAISLLAVGGFFFIRKRKEDR